VFHTKLLFKSVCRGTRYRFRVLCFEYLHGNQEFVVLGLEQRPIQLTHPQTIFHKNKDFFQLRVSNLQVKIFEKQSTFLGVYIDNSKKKLTLKN